MSQKVSRKAAAVTEEKEKRNSPVKEMKKKMAANAEKEKQAAEKVTEKAEKGTDKPEKVTEKPEKVVEKTVEKAVEKTDKQDKNEKADKSGDKKTEKEKQTEKKSEPQAEKSKGDSNKEDKSKEGKPEKPDTKKEPSKQKQNGRERVHNGVSDVTLGTNGTDDVLNGTVSADSEDDDVMLVIDDHENDELFPELTYDDTSDIECFEPPTPENAPSRSFTRRSQVKSTRTPETPRPASDKLTDKEPDDPKDKVLKLKEDAPSTDRKLRSADSPKPQEVKKPEPTKKDSPKKSQEKETAKDAQEIIEEGKTQEEAKKDEKSQESEKVVMEVTVEVEGSEGDELRKTDTNFSKSRVKVSPYRRSMRIADQTNTSVQANYTGNNTTMEMDITESSSFMEDTPLDDSSYLRGLRSIRGRSSYKPLKEITLRHVTANRSVRSAASTSALECHSRPTGTVVGRKRKPDAEAGAEPCDGRAGPKRRVLERLAEPFRRVAAAAALPAAARRNAEIVGINTDLPLTAPVASTDTFDPESLKPAAIPSTSEPIAVPLPTHEERDNKRCVIM